MKVSKYQITITGHEGQGIVVYHDDVFNSFISQFKPCLNDKSLNWLLSHLPSTESAIGEWLVLPGKGKVQLEHISLLASNQVMALFCAMYQAKTGVKYKPSAPDAGKITHLCKDAHKWDKLLQTYFDSSNFLFKGKYSVANLVKYFNELNAEAFGIKPEKTYPLPFQPEYFAQLDLMGKRGYQDFLKKNGYRFEFDAGRGRGGKWVKDQFTTAQI